MSGGGEVIERSAAAAAAAAAAATAAVAAVAAVATAATAAAVAAVAAVAAAAPAAAVAAFLRRTTTNAVVQRRDDTNVRMCAVSLHMGANCPCRQLVSDASAVQN